MGSTKNLFAKRKSGSEFPVEIMLNPTLTAEGRIVIAILRDITERNEASIRISTLLQHMQNASDAAGIGHWTFDEAKGELWCDGMTSSLCGGKPEDFPDAESLRERMVREDREPRRQKALESIRLKARYESELRVVHPDGSVHWLGDFGRLVPVEGTDKKNFHGVTFDITDRKTLETKAREANERERELFDLAPEGILVADSNGSYTDANAAACGMLGWAKSEILGKNILDTVSTDEVLRWEQAKTTLLTGIIQTMEWNLQRKDGSTFPAEITAKIFEDGRWQSFVRNISDRKNAERLKDELLGRLDASLREIKVLRGFLPICAHCKNIRDEKGAWKQMEVFIQERTNAEFSHSICPSCMHVHYPEYG